MPYEELRLGVAMTKRIVIACLCLAALAGCAAPERGGDQAADQSCIAMATTGDMYRYCKQVGPDQARQAMHAGPQQALQP